MHITADFVARHVLAVLSAIVVVTLILSAVFWWAVTTFGPRVWSLALAGWDAVRRMPPAQRLRQIPMVRPLFTRTLTIARYLGIVAVLGFILAAASVVAFFELADEIGVGESLAEFDDALSAALREHTSRDMLEFMSVVTHLGDSAFLTLLAGVVGLVLLVQRERLLAAAWLAATASGGLLTTLLKAIFQRTRPVHDHGLTEVSGWSFPSGHASGSMLVYGLLTYVIVRHTPAAWHIPVALVGVALITFVGSSRVILQVHYLSDVLAGYVSAAAWVALWIAALETARRRAGRSAAAAA